MAPHPKPLSGDAFHDASNTGPRATHNIPNGGVFSIYAEAEINAPPQAVLDALLDIQNWKEWNTFVYDVSITSHPHSHLKHLTMLEGTNMIFHSQMTEAEKTTSREACSHISQLRTLENHAAPAITHVRWDLHNAAMMMPGFLLKAQRVNELEDLGVGKTQYRTWQTFAGWTASTVKKKYEQALKDRFQDWCRDLKMYVEGKQGMSGQAAQANAETDG